MTDTYPKMNKINELAAELIAEIKARETAIHSEISYADYCEVGDEISYLIMRGWDEESAKDKAGSNVERYRMENGYSTPYDEELKTIAAALKILEQLTIKE